MASSRTSELVSIIALHTGKIEDHLAKQCLQTLSFDAKTNSQLHRMNEIAAQRHIILDATEELHALMLGPKGILMSQPVSAAAPIPSSAYRVMLELTHCPLVTDTFLDGDAGNLPLRFGNKIPSRHGRSDIRRACCRGGSPGMSHSEASSLLDDVPHFPRTSQGSGCPYSSIEIARGRSVDERMDWHGF